MRDQEYEREKAERARKDKKRSMIIFPLLFLVLVGGIVFIVYKV